MAQSQYRIVAALTVLPAISGESDMRFNFSGSIFNNIDGDTPMPFSFDTGISFTMRNSEIRAGLIQQLINYISENASPPIGTPVEDDLFIVGLPSA